MSTLHTPVGTSPTLVYSPAPSGTPHATIFNEGAATAYIGGGTAVTATSGLALLPNAEISFAVAPYAIYAIAATGTGTSIHTEAGAG